MELDKITNEVKYKLDIVDIIGNVVSLKRAGKDFKACCPFHNEKTPSFVVNQEKQIFHCFGCGVGGDIFSFMMKYENLNFMEALKMLADKCGVAVVLDSNNTDGLSSDSKTELFNVNEFALEYYHKLLKSTSGQVAVDYLLNRGMLKKSMEFFKVGYATPAWDGLIKAASLKKVSLDVLQKSGLIIKKEGGNSYYDRFRGRIVIPLYDVLNRVVGFTARVLDNSLPKYVNSPETPVFSKGQMLFGLNFAKRDIIEKGKVVVCEGQLDVISLMQEGINNVVASQGTAFTAYQARLLKRYAGEVVLAFDADEAGINAQLKSIDVLLAEGLAVKIVELPGGEDPDSLIKKIKQKKFQELIDEAIPFLEFKLKILTATNNINDEVGKNKIALEMLDTIARLSSRITQGTYIDKLSDTLSVSAEILWGELEKLVKQKAGKSEVGLKIKFKETLMPSGERSFIKLLLEEQDKAILQEIFDYIDIDDFSDARCRTIFAKILEAYQQNADISTLSVGILDESLKQVIANILAERIDRKDKAKDIRDNILNIKNLSLQRKIKSNAAFLHDLEKKQDIAQQNLLSHEIMQRKQELFKLKQKFLQQNK